MVAHICVCLNGARMSWHAGSSATADNECITAIVAKLAKTANDIHLRLLFDGANFKACKKQCESTQRASDSNK